jgi:outer membrane protein
MMKKFLAVTILGLFMLSAGMISTTFAADAVKIGIVDLLRALNESEAGKKAKTELESLIMSKQASIDEKGKRVETLRADLEKQAAVLSADARKARAEEIGRLEKNLQRLIADSQAEIQKKQMELENEILKDLRDVINAIAQAGGYSMVIERADGLVLYVDKSIDITDAVIKRYNESKAKPTK